MNDSDEFEKIKEKLAKNGLQLAPHQESGLAALSAWEAAGRGGIVADEMGLGKTATAVVHLWRLLLRRGADDKGGAFLVLCPLSVLDHWKSEIARFSCGALEAITYAGSLDERRALVRSLSGYRFRAGQVVVVPHHLYVNDYSELLAKVAERSAFTHVVVDEAHRLKNPTALITLRVAQLLPASRFLLLTGTPIQNNLTELYTLLSFVDTARFPREEASNFVARHAKQDYVDELKGILAEYSLRRRKEVVCKDLPHIEQVVFYHGLTEQQKQLYINILVKNHVAIRNGNSSAISLCQQMMHVRKCVGHPYLFPGQEPEPFEEGEHLVTASGKFQVLDALLKYALRFGHRCLIFSQFVILLDIVQDYLNMRNWRYERIDGSARADERFDAIARFQGKAKQNGAASDECSIFLLTTRAGGVGLTLTAADTVIFLDSDWNPQSDLQAMARCHRIGQNKPVRVIRLVARYTVEQLMQSRARSKLRFTDNLIGEKSAKPLAVDVARVLQCGLARLKEEKTSGSLTDADIERVVGGTDANGHWLPLGGEGEEEEEEGGEGEGGERMTRIDDVDVVDNEDVDEKDYFYFEGVRYRVDERDEEAVNELAKEMKFLSPVRNHPKPVRSKEDVELMRQTRKAAAEQRKKKKWEEAGYTSRNLPEKAEENEKEKENRPSEEEEEEEEEGEAKEEEEEEPVDPEFVSGNVAEPLADGHVIVLHCVDDSGEFGWGGVFIALREVDEGIVQSYELAGEMKDLALGDAHLVQVDPPPDERYSRYDVALLVSQRKAKRDEMREETLARCFERVSMYAKAHGASVHMAKIGHRISGVTWYGIERMLTKYFSHHGIPLFVYCFPRKGAGRIEKRERRWSGEKDDEEEKEPPMKKRKKPLAGGYGVLKGRRVIIDSDSDEEKKEGGEESEGAEKRPGTSKADHHAKDLAETTASWNCKKEEEKNGIFAGRTFYVHSSATEKKIVIRRLGGAVVEDKFDLYDIDYMVMAGAGEEERKKTPEEAATLLSLLPPHAKVVEPEIIDKWERDGKIEE